MNKAPLFLLPLALAATGCLLGPDFESPERPAGVPESFRGAATNETAAVPGDVVQWIAAWNDPVLDSLVAEGLSSNLTLQATAARIVESRASFRQSLAALSPSLGIGGGATKNKTWDPDDSSKAFRAAADAGWEIDLFGKNLRAAEASLAEYEVAGLTYEDARLSLAAEIAADYVQLRLAQTQLDIARTNLEAEIASAEIARAKGESGFTAGSDVAAAEAAIATARAAIPARETAVSAAARALEKLLAKGPFELEAALEAAAPVPTVPAPPAVAPAEVLARRADVRKAEASLHAATARIGVARAARYPSISLAAGYSASAADLAEWSNAMKSFSFGPTVNLPLFQGGRLRAAEDQARAAADESLLQYHDTVLSAIHETQDFWTRLSAEQTREELLAAAVKHDEDALEAAQSLYRAGRADYTTVIVRQTALLSARQAYAQHSADLATLSISLMKAIGGPIR